MVSNTSNSNGFCTARVSSLQPHMSANDLLGPSLLCEDPLVANDMLNLIRLWSRSDTGLPDDFCDEVRITSIKRQPVTIIHMELQRVRRDLKAVDEPFDGSILNQQEWKTQDLFELMPFAALSFPTDRVEEKQRVAGREKARRCDSCDGAGKKICRNCEGSGQVACTNCDGNGEIKCSACGGAGVVVRAGESATACQKCVNGVISCPHCKRRGYVRCKTCEDGQVICSKCLGFGQLKRCWDLHTDISTILQDQPLLHEDWSINVNALIESADVVQSYEWPSPTAAGLPASVKHGVPPPLLPKIEDQFSRLIQDQDTPDSKNKRLSGLRFQLRGAYLFRVQYEYQGLPGVLILGGTKNHVFLNHPPKPRVSLLQRFLDWLNRFLTFFGLGDAPSLSRDYVHAVKRGDAHLSDPRVIVPALENYGANVLLTHEGYKVTISAATDSGDDMKVHYDVRVLVNNLRETVLTTMCRLGPAHRDRFPVALALNHRICMGRLAVVQDADSKEDFFTIVDRRPYETIQEAQYACLLIDLTNDILTLQSERVLC